MAYYQFFSFLSFFFARPMYERRLRINQTLIRSIWRLFHWIYVNLCGRRARNVNTDWAKTYVTYTANSWAMYIYRGNSWLVVRITIERRCPCNSSLRVYSRQQMFNDGTIAWIGNRFRHRICRGLMIIFFYPTNAQGKPTIRGINAVISITLFIANMRKGVENILTKL